MAIVYDSFFNGAVFGGGFFKAGTETDTVDTHDGAGYDSSQWVYVKGKRKKRADKWVREELEAVYRAMSGEGTVAESLHEIVEPFVKKSEIDEIERKIIPLPSIDWRKLSRNVDAVRELTTLYAKYYQDMVDDDEAAANLLLM